MSLLTEDLHRREVDRRVPSDQSEAESRIAREVSADLELDLIGEALPDPDAPGFVEELVVFAATIIEEWAVQSGREPLDLLREIALRPAMEDGDGS